MGTTRILVVRPSEDLPPLALAEWLADSGARSRVVDPAAEELPDATEYDGIVVLDGEMSALDDPSYPWLSSVRSLLSQAVAHQIPVLAVCLGAQLLAMATGGRVREGRNGPEAGTLLIAKRDRATEDRLFGPLPLMPDVLQFHADEIATLPPTAELLASSPKYDNQAFRVGECAYGLQFHIEAMPDQVLDRVERSPEIAVAARPGHWDPEHLADFHNELAECWRPMVEEFVRLAAMPPEQRRSNRTLPLI